MASTIEFPELPDYEELPPPQPIQQATADEASKEVLSAMVDLYDSIDDDKFSLDFLLIAYYILRHTEAQHYVAAQPQIGAALRRYTTYLFSTNSSIYWTLCDFSALLQRLGA
jgi:hypothetical protein